MAGKWKAPKIKSLKEQIAENRKGIRYLSMIAVDPKPFQEPKQLSNERIFQGRNSSAKKDSPLENVLKLDALKYLRLHPKVHWRCRINSGTVNIGGRHVSFNSQAGISDIIGMLKNGRFFAIETKRLGEEPTQDQQDYIDMINDGGGLAFYADTLDQIIERINAEA